MTDSASGFDLQTTEDDLEVENEVQFDFAEHRRVAVEEYLRIRTRYEAFAYSVREILYQALKTAGILVNSVDARAKDPESFGAKAETPAEDDPQAPKYPQPLQDITDLTGVRVITFFPGTLQNIGDCIRREFEVLEHTDLSRALLQEERFGYQSEHYLVRLGSGRTVLPEYEPHQGLVAEIQVRTILQHAWAEIEHDIQYKSSITIPNSIRRRFMSLAGLLEIADREFQAIQDEDEILKQHTGTSVEEGALDQIEITAHALRSYLHKKFESVGRGHDYSSEYYARLLRRLGFTTIDQLDTCIKDYDVTEFTKIVRRGREGPPIRLQDLLLAGMGSVFVESRAKDPVRKDSLRARLSRYERWGIPVGEYDPNKDVRN